MSDAIEVHDVSKRYRLGTDQAAYGTLREALAGLARRRSDTRAAPREIWALRDVSFTVEQGEALGVVGGNGAGKSTLLRILGRITEPTSGMSRTRGRVGALLEVGTGFHSELSGRENVFLSGAIMGMTRADIRRRFDDIVEFAGVQAFIDTPIKRYSSGMGLRLAFAVAAHLEPEIMLVDEVLAVGDIDFQRRCLERMDQLSHEGRTVVFISHDLGAVSRLCSRALRLDRGAIVDAGPAERVVRDYYTTVFRHADTEVRDIAGDAGVRRVALVGADGEPVGRPQRGDPLRIEIELELRRAIAGLDLSVWMTSSSGVRVLDESWSDQVQLPLLPDRAGRHLVTLEVPAMLPAGDYVIGVWLGTELHTYVFEDLLTATVSPRPEDRGEWAARDRVVQPEVRWSAASRAEAP